MFLNRKPTLPIQHLEPIIPIGQRKTMETLMAAIVVGRSAPAETQFRTARKS